MSGLTLKQQLGLNVSNAQASYEKLQVSSKLLHSYYESLIEATNIFKTALEEQNIEQLFELEKVAQEFDYQRTLDAEKRRNSLTALETIRNNWINCQNPNFVRRHFSNAHSGIGMATKPVKDTAMDTNIQSQCKKLSVLGSGLAAPAEKLFYKVRQDCLKFIGKQHNLMINQHLGLIKSQSQDLSR